MLLTFCQAYTQHGPSIYNNNIQQIFETGFINIEKFCLYIRVFLIYRFFAFKILLFIYELKVLASDVVTHKLLL